jgi:hypothetical protein
MARKATDCSISSTRLLAAPIENQYGPVEREANRVPRQPWLAAIFAVYCWAPRPRISPIVS